MGDTKPDLFAYLEKMNKDIKDEIRRSETSVKEEVSKVKIDLDTVKLNMKKLADDVHDIKVKNNADSEKVVHIEHDISDMKDQRKQMGRTCGGLEGRLNDIEHDLDIRADSDNVYKNYKANKISELKAKLTEMENNRKKDDHVNDLFKDKYSEKGEISKNSESATPNVDPKDSANEVTMRTDLLKNRKTKILDEARKKLGLWPVAMSDIEKIYE